MLLMLAQQVEGRAQVRWKVSECCVFAGVPAQSEAVHGQEDVNRGAAEAAVGAHSHR